MLILSLPIILSAMISNLTFEAMCSLDVPNSPQWRVYVYSKELKGDRLFQELQVSESREYIDTFSGTKKITHMDWNHEIYQFTFRKPAQDRLMDLVWNEGQDMTPEDVRLFGPIEIVFESKRDITVSGSGSNVLLNEARKGRESTFKSHPLLTNSISFTFKNGRGRLVVNGNVLGEDLICDGKVIE